MIDNVERLAPTSRIAPVRDAQARGIAWLRDPERSSTETVVLFGASDVADFKRVDKVLLGELDDLILSSVRADWPAHIAHRRDLSALLHRVGFGYVNARERTLVGDADRDDGLERTHDATDLARAAPRMQFHPHVLLTFRCSGLVFSKRDRYTSAWLFFAEGRRRLAHFARSVSAADDELERMRLEVRERLLLGETGTASRVVERNLQDFADNPALAVTRHERLMFHHSFDVLMRGVATGDQSDRDIRELAKRDEDERDQDHIATYDSMRRPGVMTARCHLELIPLCRIVEAYGTKHPQRDDWDAEVAFHRRRFQALYRQALEDSRIGAADRQHERELVQLRLHYALLFPNERLDRLRRTTGRPAARVLRRRRPSRELLANWLTSNGHDANIAASITSPTYLAWMQEISRCDDLIDWLLDERRDNLRRLSTKKLLTTHRERLRVDAKRIAAALAADRLSSDAGHVVA